MFFMVFSFAPCRGALKFLFCFLFVFTVNTIHHFENKVNTICLQCKHFGVLYSFRALFVFTLPHFCVSLSH